MTVCAEVSDQYAITGWLDPADKASPRRGIALRRLQMKTTIDQSSRRPAAETSGDHCGLFLDPMSRFLSTCSSCLVRVRARLGGRSGNGLPGDYDLLVVVENEQQVNDPGCGELERKVRARSSGDTPLTFIVHDIVLSTKRSRSVFFRTSQKRRSDASSTERRFSSRKTAEGADRSGTARWRNGNFKKRGLTCDGILARCRYYASTKSLSMPPSCFIRRRALLSRGDPCLFGIQTENP